MSNASQAPIGPSAQAILLPSPTQLGEKRPLSGTLDWSSLLHTFIIMRIAFQLHCSVGHRSKPSLKWRSIFSAACPSLLSRWDLQGDCIPKMQCQFKDVSDLCAMLKASFVFYQQANFNHQNFTKWLDWELKKVVTSSNASSSYSEEVIVAARKRVCNIMSVLSTTQPL